MKYCLSLLVAAALVGFACFAVVYWLVKWTYTESVIFGVSAAISGLAVELMKPLWTKKKPSGKE